MKDLRKKIKKALTDSPADMTTDQRVDRILEVLDGFVHSDDLMGLGDVAVFFGVGVTTAANWRDRAHKIGMPPPLAQLSSGPAWDGNELVEWWTHWVPATRGRKAGSLPWDREAA